MAPETPNDPLLAEGAPLPSAADGDAKAPTAEITAELRAEVDGDTAVSAPNPVLDALVARDAAAAAAEARPAAPPAQPTTPAQEWGAAVVLMILFMFICVAAMSFFRG